MAVLLSLLLLLPSLAAASPIQGCTSTTTITVANGPETWVPTVTQTSYEATSTVSEAFDCDGCTAIATQFIAVDRWYSEGAPEYVVETATDATTLTQGFCAASSQAAPDVDLKARRCTSSLTIFPTLTSGPTKTVFTLTKTRTYTVDCNGCDSVATTTLRLGPGPQIIYTVTTTVPTASTVSVYACSSS